MATIEESLKRRQEEAGPAPSVPIELTPPQQEILTSFEEARSSTAQLIDLQEGFNTPEDWSQTVQFQVDRMLQAQTAGAATAEELGDDFLPIAWKETYLTQKNGPRGESLPASAQGWLPTGQPDFGGGFTGLWKKGLYNLWDRPKGQVDPSKEWQTALDNYTTTVNEFRFDESLKKGDFTQVAKQLRGRVAPSFGLALDAFRITWSQAEDNNTVFSWLTRFIGTVADTTFGVFEEAGKAIRNEYIGPSVLAADEVLRKGLDAGTIPAGEEKWLEKFRKGGAFTALAPIAQVHRLHIQGLLDGKQYVDLEEFRELRRDEQLRDAAQMAYTGWWDPAAKAEFDRRYQSGIDPRLLALELENPGAEMLGLAVYDPLNLFDVFFVGAKLTKASQLVRNTRTYARTKPSVLAAINDFANAGEATSDVAFRNLVDEIGTMMDEAQSGITDAAGQRGLILQGGRTAGHKRAVFGQQANTFMSNVISATADKPDVTNSIWHSLVLMQDAGTREEGIFRLTQAIRDAEGALPAEVLLSPAANQTGYLLRRLLNDADGNFDPNIITNLIEEAGDDPAKLAGLLDKRLNNVIDEIHPNVQEQVALHEEYLKLEGDEATNFLAKNPLSDRDPGSLYRSLAKADETLQPLYQRMGEIQSRLFMGTPPQSLRYNVNNRWGNFMPTLVDMGPKPAVKGFLRGIERFVPSMGPTASFDNISNQLGGVLNEGALRGIGPGSSFRGGQDLVDMAADGDWFKRFTTHGLKAAQRDEQVQALHVSSESINRTMGSYMKAERGLMRDELADLPKDLQNLIGNVYRDSFYSTTAAADAARAEDGYDIARNLAWLNDAEVRELKDLRIYDDARAIARQGGPQDDIIRQIDELVEDRRNFGRAAANETSVNALDDTGEMGVRGFENQTIASDADTISEFEKNNDAMSMFDRRVTANREVDILYQEALYGEDGLQTVARNAIYDQVIETAGDLNLSKAEHSEMIRSAMRGFNGTVQPDIERARTATFAAADEYRKSVRLTSRNSKGVRTGDAWLTQKWEEYSGVAENLGLPGFGPVPDNITASTLRDTLWDHPTSNFRQVQQARYTKLKDDNVILFREAANRFALAAGRETIFTPSVMRAENAYTNAAMLDRAKLVDNRMVLDFSADADGISELMPQILDGLRVSPDIHTGLIEEAGGLGLARIQAVEGGYEITLTDELLNQDLSVIKESLAHEISHIFEDTDEGAQILDNLYDGDFEEFVRDILYRTGLRIENPPDPEKLEALATMMGNNPDIRNAIRVIGDLEQSGDNLRLPLVGALDDAAPTPNRIFHETQPVARDAGDRLIQGLRDNWGNRGPGGALSLEAESAISAWQQNARGRRTTARFTSAGIANDARDLILHNYPARYGIDLVAGYIWPYQFWHSRTYMRWMKRLMMHPGLTQAYADYRAAMEKKHAGLPPWWRRNINVTELLGLDVDTPLWFNLEQTLNPLNGLTGVDFNDPKKRLDMWSATVDDLNKFGPSVWMPYQVALALKYHIDGEEDAASRWAGRLWSPTGTFRDLTAMIDPKGLGVEVDPFIHLFSGGIGPYERPRVGRQLTAMQQEGLYGEAELIDAAFAQTGPIWDEARARAINLRAPNLLATAAPFFLGGGFKPRTQEDAQIDMFYAEMFSVIRQKEDLSTEEYRAKWNDLERRYPFMDTLLLAKKGGPERDEALAWTVLDRIPPGMRDDLAEMVGIDFQIIQNFYDSNSNLEEMTKGERTLFMGAILEMAAILDVPDQATKAEWEASKALYGKMRDLGQEIYGDDIWEKVDVFWAMFDPENREASDAYLKANPVVQEAQDWQTRMIMSTPLLGSYYTSAERIRKFYKRQLYDAAEEIFGEDLWDHLAVQSALFDLGDKKAAFQYRDDHPQLKGWTELRDQTLPDIEAKVNRLGELLPEAIGPIFRDKDQAEVPDGPPLPSREDWINAQILAYATGQQQEDTPKDIRQFIREQADNRFPGTRAEANLYYQRLDKKIEVAQNMLMFNTALSARIAWEIDALRNLSLVQQGQFAQIGEQQFEPPSPTWNEWQGVLTMPVWRLARDHLRYGDTLSDDETAELEDTAQNFGIGFDELMFRLQGAYEEAEGALSNQTPVP